jgi:O-antigen biosynthesis protein
MGNDDRDTLKAARPAPGDGTAAGQRTDEPVAGARIASGAILVLGMHRSGTSAVARLIAADGAYAGADEELLPADPRDNPQGYWERNDLMLEHDRFLREAGYAWDRVAGFDARRIDADARRTLETHLRDIVAPLQSHGTPWLIKDPRLCLLLPFWLPLVGDAACIVVVRDPREIAASLRDTHRGVFTSVFPLLLWEKYMRTLLAALVGRRALFVSYATLMRDPGIQHDRLLAGLEALGVRGLEHAAADTARLLDPRLRRSAAEAHIRLSDEQAALIDWLEAQARMPGPVEVRGVPHAPMPDTQLREFEDAFAHFGEAGRKRGLNDAAEHIHRVNAELSNAAEHIQRVDAGMRRLSGDLEAQREQTTQAQYELGAQREANSHLRGELDNAERKLEFFDKYSSDLKAAVAALKASWSWKITAPLRGVAGLLGGRSLSARSEHRLYRWYYAIPGLSISRKRALVVWLHRHAPWFTQRTLSHQLYARSQQAAAPVKTVAPRMDADRAAAIITGLASQPMISIVMPVYNVDKEWLHEAVESVRRQFYPRWELCIADDASTRWGTRRALDALEGSDARIRIVRLPQNLGIAGASNAALNLATGDYVGLLDHDDALTRDALLEVVQRIATNDADIVYSDEDKLDFDGYHVEAHFKPDFNVDYFFALNYISHFVVLRRPLLERIGGFRPGFDGAQDYDLLLRATERGECVEHVPKVLYHWRKTEASTASSSSAKPKSWEAGRKALAESVARRGISANVEPGPYPNTYRVRRAIRGQPLVSILLPFRDKPELLSTCVRSIIARTDYAHFEVLGIDNGSSDAATHALMHELEQLDSRVRFVRHDVPFNYSRINNFAATQARGEHLLLLNNDTEVISGGWMRAMLEHSQRPEVGVVGAKLLYGDGRIQHAGVVIGIGGVAGHVHLFEAGDRAGYFNRVQLPHDLSAVTFACAMTRREVFEQLGGLNETDLTIAFNDIDYCLRAREAGYLVVYTPYAELYHYESRTRGYEDDAEKQTRFFGEITYMQSRHAAILKNGDPYYNPNLRLDTNDFSPVPGYVEALPV